MNKILIIVLLCCCSCAPKVINFVKSDASFKNYETFLLTSTKVESKNLSSGNAAFLRHLKQEITHQMNRRDYQISNIGPDLILRYELASSQRMDIRPVQTFSYFPSFNINSRSILESVLIIELFDNKRKLIWQASYDLEHERKESKTLKIISKAVERAFTTYPYRAKSNKLDETLTKMEKKKDKQNND